ncbi:MULTISPECIES: GH25 family lysozyme [unclassified Butyrivibrio]|uniref:GH25 family lysozyme n=1 Tax=unclassified Butyrivibrio TaxID=2639466 RepID=UPI0008B08F17|nr:MULTISPECIES: GH25 family lysozyme [unclassified Butyrivibrio]SEL28016.1 lysozyme [Butyrivibrio sp. ob235]
MKIPRKTALVVGGLIFAALICFMIAVSAPVASKRYSIKGIDVSHHQGNIDWPRVSGHGISFAYIKATEGSGYVDEKLADNYDGVSKTDINYGFYHFLSLESSSETQMDNFREAVKEYKMELIPAIDVEWYGDMRKNPPQKELVISKLKELSALMEEEYGTKPVIYTTQTFYFKYLRGEIGENPLWIRNTFFFPVQDFVIWQYSEKLDLGDAIELGRYVDVDVMTSDAQLKMDIDQAIYR